MLLNPERMLSETRTNLLYIQLTDDPVPPILQILFKILQLHTIREVNDFSIRSMALCLNPAEEFLDCFGFARPPPSRHLRCLYSLADYYWAGSPEIYHFA
jgi:hypothetical protein